MVRWKRHLVAVGGGACMGAVAVYAVGVAKGYLPMVFGRWI